MNKRILRETIPNKNKYFQCKHFINIKEALNDSYSLPFIPCTRTIYCLTIFFNLIFLSLLKIMKKIRNV